MEKWTAIREIGVVYDAALVVTTDRPTPSSPPSDDTFTIWNVSLTSHIVAPLLKGVNLRWFDWEHFADGAPEELTALYDNCHDCAASTYFTAFYYDIAHHMWAARWVRGGQGVLVWNAVQPSASGVAWTQVYAVMADPDGRALAAPPGITSTTASRERPSDTIFRYDVDPFSGLERTVELTGDDAKPWSCACAAARTRCRVSSAGRTRRSAQQLHECAASAQACDHAAGQQPRPVHAARRPALSRTSTATSDPQLFRCPGVCTVRCRSLQTQAGPQVS